MKSNPALLSWSRALPTALTAVLAGLVVACSGPGEPAPPESTASITEDSTEDAALPTLEVRAVRAHVTGETGALYFEVVNSGDAADRLVAVDSPGAVSADLHETVEEDGVMRMLSRSEGFEISPGETLVFQPGGKHVMLMQPSASEEDGPLPVTLRFETTGIVKVEAEWMDLAGGDHGAMDHGSMDHGSMDHGEMDHGEMDHESMDHGGNDHGDEGREAGHGEGSHAGHGG